MDILADVKGEKFRVSSFENGFGAAGKNRRGGSRTAPVKGAFYAPSTMQMIGNDALGA
jgi:hypothetical protein